MTVNLGGEPPGGQGRASMSWAERLGSSLPSSLNKNVLEVVLEKDTRGAFAVTEEECARMMKKVGLDLLPGGQVEGVQICPNGRGVIFITLKDHVEMEKFCSYDIIAITSSGIRGTMVKPAGKKEVVISIKGIHPNTKDSLVIDYLSKFGRVVSTKVVHGVFSEGPLRGIRNGDRAFKMEVKAGENIGSYHYIDGHKVSLRYPGQHQTCGRCHEIPRNCKGKGLAKKCEAEGGPKVDFTDHILALWQKIGYKPPTGDEVRNELEENIVETEFFTPSRVTVSDEEMFAGVSIRQFPKDLDQGEVMEFLCQHGLIEAKKDETIFKSNGVVTIPNLDNETCKAMIAAIHGKVNFGRKMFCNGIIPLTPDKSCPTLSTEDSSKVVAATSPKCQAPPALPLTAPCLPPVPSVSFSAATTGSQSVPDKSPSFLAAQETFLELESKTSNFPSSGTIARRHSLSIIDRTPPRNSLASELLQFETSRPDFHRTKAVMSELKELTQRLSDFESCVSHNSSSSDDSEHEGLAIEGFKSVNEKNRIKKSKRKLKITPNKEDFLKKPNNKKN